MDSAELVEKLVSWIKDKVLAGGCRGTILGMSGGVDSALVAVLCQRAFPQNVLGVLIPCHSDPQDAEHARLVAEKFSIPTRTVVLDNIYDSLLQILPEVSADPATSRLARANLKVRLRMVTLYYLANQLKYMVVGSSNRSEVAVGYFTKYGDGGVDIMPLGNLLKRQVKELSRFLGIPREIIDKPATAGLWPGQTDEGDFGFSYDDLDRYLTTNEAASAVRAKVESMIAASGHKRQLPPFPPF
jgi:NAD+ synthase